MRERLASASACDARCASDQPGPLTHSAMVGAGAGAVATVAEGSVVTDRRDAPGAQFSEIVGVAGRLRRLRR